jgi:hypothetical protein
MDDWSATPTFRSFEYFLGYYNGGEDYYTHMTAGGYDMRRDFAPNCGPNCSEVAWDLQGQYSTNFFTSRAVEVIETHNPAVDGNLFLYLAYQGVHSPDECPAQYVDPYNATIPNDTFRSMWRTWGNVGCGSRMRAERRMQGECGE